MKRLICFILFTSFCVLGHGEVNFDEWFTRETLRLDYLFSGDAKSESIFFREASRTSKWAGRTSHLDECPLRGNGSISVRDAASGKLLYINPFSTLFQEWVTYEEATQVQRAFENCFQVPFPKTPVMVTVTLTDNRGEVAATLTHRIDPSDILIRHIGDNGIPRRVIHEGGENAIDVVFLAEGYTADEADKFFADAERGVRAFFGYEPFKGNEDKFRFVAVATPSAQSGVSIPHKDLWLDTAVGSHFDTFYTERYLTTVEMRTVYDLLGNVPFEHVIVLANTPVYGGGGVYNNVTIMASDTPPFEPVLVHEFGHAFGGLADEYAYDDMYDTLYPEGVEPWEPNITTLADFGSKWADMLPSGTTIPSPLDAVEHEGDVRRMWSGLSPETRLSLNQKIGVYEGAGYVSKGVFRPVQECRMRINECEDFCPVCMRALRRLIAFYTE